VRSTIFWPLQATATGIALSAVNPKNLILTLAAATTIAATDLPGTDQVVAFVVYALIATTGATYGTFGAACHYVDGTFVYASAQSKSAATSPQTGGLVGTSYGLGHRLWDKRPGGPLGGSRYRRGKPLFSRRR